MADRPVISVLLPSRGRPDLLAAAVGSLRGHAACPGRVHVFVAADDDDPVTIERAHALGVNCLISSPAGYEGLGLYYQSLASAAMAEEPAWLLVWNDDATMLTAHWDRVLDRVRPWVLVADLHSRHSPICAFPAVRGEAAEAIGRFCSTNPHVDSFWEVVGRMSGTLATVAIEVHHDQRSPAHHRHEHGFHDPAHQDELRSCAETIRRRKGSRHG